MATHFLALLIMLFVGTGTRVVHKETRLTWSQAITIEDSLKRKQPQPFQHNSRRAINQNKPVWKRVGKALLYVVIVLAAIYLLVLFVVLALTSGRSK